METHLTGADDVSAWNAALAKFSARDVCHMPEYHSAYATRFAGGAAQLWHCNRDGEHFAYPFLKAPVTLGEETTGYYDISGVYGYSGPLCTTQDEAFLSAAWAAFDIWAEQEKILCEFVRYSPYLENHWLRPHGVELLENRQLAICEIPESEEALLQALGSKTRNMLRKAEKSGLTAREMDVRGELNAFRNLYDATMARNEATAFFHYDDAYYAQLTALPPGALRLFGVYHGEQLVSVAMVLVQGENALYHLGASEGDYTRLGAGNLALFAMHKALMEVGVKFVNLTGGRSTALDDALLRFKKNNGTGLKAFHIGKRILNETAYADIVKRWSALYGEAPDMTKLQFYR